MKPAIFRCISNAALFGAALLMALPAQAQEKELRFALWMPAQAPQYKTGLAPWAKQLEEASAGTLKVSMFPAEQLGKAQDHYDMAIRGIADITFVNPGYTPGRFKILGATELPFLVSDGTGGSVAINEWYKTYRAEEMGGVNVCANYVHLPGTIHSKRPVRAPEDVKNLSVRPAHRAIAQLVSGLGGVNVQVGAPEVGQALSSDLAHAVTFPWSGVRIFRLEKSVPHHLDLPLYTTNAFIVVGKSTYDGLTPAQRRAVDQMCSTEQVAKLAANWEKVESAIYSEIKASGDHTFHKPDAAELARWRQAVAPLYDAYVKEIDGIGRDGQAILNDLRAKLKSEGALAAF